MTQAYDKCGGQNVSPTLRWHGAPTGTRSYALTMFDPDARSGVGWWHWLVYDIPAASTELATGAGSGAHPSIPAGALQAHNDFGEAAYGGPCPPKGDKPHHYVFTLYALKSARLEVAATASAADIERAARAQSLGSATLTGLYGR
ncbi:MAG TPA: YbhB/YbcL family Raf kinase inhibitor-like protein [Steroidobacteraceae bacterium]|nr:YbhB/YbcL family Raf kinase inhibitor-like protein [Steroidobacteraceae bacterium]